MKSIATDMFRHRTYHRRQSDGSMKIYQLAMILGLADILPGQIPA
jgi:hypothetical protein